MIIKPGRTTEFLRSGTGQAEEQKSGAGPEAQRPQATPPSVQGRPADQSGAGAAGAWRPGFALTYPKRTPLDLGKPSENSLEDFLKPSRYQTRTDIDFSKYLGSHVPLSGPPGGGGTPGAGGKGPGGQARGASVSLNIARYDFSPWANEVMNRIQKNWSLGQSSTGSWKGEVGISVLMTKSGELLAVEVASTSKVDVLDQAALRALQMSAPFPPLPADFPNARLEMYFVFQYGY